MSTFTFGTLFGSFVYFSSSNIFNAGLLLVTEYFYSVVFLLQ